MRTMRTMRTMNTALLLLSAGVLGLTSVAACDTEDATTVVVDNHDPSVVYRAWWVTTYFDNPVAAGTTSDSLRAVPVIGPAYALLAPGWDATSSTAPTSYAVRQTRAPLSITRGRELHIVVSDDAFLGSCGAPLSGDDRTFIAERIFPGELTGFTYDATTCLFTPTPADAGTDAGDGG